MKMLKGLIALVAAFLMGFLLMTSLAQAKDITIAWDANTDPDLAGYELYQAEKLKDGTTAWEFVANIPAGTETYTVLDLDDKKDWAFIMIAYDTRGNKSLMSNLAINEDKIPPGQVRNLRE